VDIKNSTAGPDNPHQSTEERPCACYEGLVYIGHLVEDESGDEVEVIARIAAKHRSGSLCLNHQRGDRQLPGIGKA
jgi:hypothetical protein